MPHPPTTFQPYDRVTGTELSLQQQRTCRPYYFIIKAYIDGIERGAGAAIPWTRKNLRCSTAELLESIEHLADDIRGRQLHNQAEADGTSSIQSWAEAEGQKLSLQGPEGTGVVLEAYQHAVNLLHEFVGRLAPASDNFSIPWKGIEHSSSIQYSVGRSGPGSDDSPKLSYATKIALESGSRSLHEIGTGTEKEVMAEDSHALPRAERHGTSFFLDPWEDSVVDLASEQNVYTVTAHSERLSRSGKWKLNKTSSWALEYLRGGWYSNSPAGATDAFRTPISPLSQEKSPDGGFRLPRRTDSDNLSMLSDDAALHASKTASTRTKERGLPIPAIASKIKGKVSFDVPRGTITRTSTTSSMDFFKTPRSILSGHSIFATPEGGHDKLEELHSTDVLSYLRQKGLIPNPFEEMDWSGRGQHAEFEASEEESVPLQHEKNLGHSATAMVDSVRCKRIRLARKVVHVSRRLKKEEALQEVEHLQRLKHSHIIRVVGTYTLPRKLSILLYPVADYTLDAFIESVDEGLPDNERVVRLYSISTFLRCLAKAVAYIHEKAMKHMDIKPKNLLVRDMHNSTICNQGKYKIYVADFGIARSYRSVDDCNTETPTAYTKTYAAPEVVAQERRDQKADIFSLGAVYAEMLSVLAAPQGTYTSNLDLLHEIRETGSIERSYAAQAAAIQHFVRDLCLTSYGFESDTIHSHITELVALMLSPNPAQRPNAANIVENIPFLAFCCDVNGGSEPFEAADRPKDRQLYDRAMEIVEADMRYWRCSVEGTGTTVL
ncbi:hypothetical protein N0V90_001429 [Kalmusia sp. IMI 367209]|nr:hypothetical protein N0V90_001429 [Kalmusia sp. IMI 367209]